MKIALVHDALVNRGGAERVFQALCSMFPESKLYTSVYFPDKTYPFFKTRDITTSRLQRYVSSESQLKALFPLANYLMGKLDVGDVDLILSSSTFSGKHIRKKNARHICYCYTPFRLLWSEGAYSTQGGMGQISRFIGPLLPPLRRWDYAAAQRVDQFIAMTEGTRKRILQHYNRDSIVIPPPIDCSRYGLSNDSEDYFLLVSRLEPYKKVDLVIDAFRKTGLHLKIVGAGSLRRSLMERNSPNIEFLGSVADEELIALYQKCRAVVFPQEEDYGLVPLEANACGKPVICYGRGGVETTMVPYTQNASSGASALFFPKQSVDSLVDALRTFEGISFNPESLVKNAKRFDLPQFCSKIRNVIENT